MIQLESSWSYWYHSSHVHKWDRSSYTSVCKTNTAEDFWGVFKLFVKPHYDNGILFIMRDDVFPDWSSPENASGGFVSVKIDNRSSGNGAGSGGDKLTDVLRLWIERLISETLRDPSQIINGISISPKNGHSILKIWLSEKIRQADIGFPSDLPMVKTCKFTPFSRKD